MADLTGTNKISNTPPILDYRNIGTAAGTTTLLSESGYLGHVNITRRVASGVIVLYDSVGTSGNVIGTIALGTQTFSDPPPTYTFNFRTTNGLTVVNPADCGALVSYGK